MAQLTGGQALVQSLLREGVDTVFGLPGVQLDYAFDALYEARDRVTLYHTRHEQATAYMADGYARSTGKPGVCMVVPGPGLLNATGALCTAYACSSPVLCVTGQIASDQIDGGRGELHEIPDSLGMIRSVTKWAGRAMTPAAVPPLVAEAFRQLRSGRPRPVELEIPPDVLAATADVHLLGTAPVERFAGDPASLDRAAVLLRGASRPLIYAGGGVLRGEAWDEVRALAELLEAPVVMSTNGRGVLSDRHYLAHTNLSGQQLLPDADVILAVGTRFTNMRAWGVPAGASVIHIDADADETARHRQYNQPVLGIVADAKAALDALRERLDGIAPRPSRRAELERLKGDADETLGAIHPQADFSRALRAALPDDGILINDVTQVGFFNTIGFPVYAPNTIIGSGYQGTLGCAFGIALGVQAGNPTKKVVSVSGDGGFLYNVQELATMKHYNLPLVAVVFNDNAFGNVKRIQQQRFGGRLIASDLTNPDFVALAHAFGIAGMRADSPAALEGTLREAFATPGPTLIEVPVGEMPGMWHILTRTLPS